MAKDDVIEVEGTVIETLPNAMFKVELRERSYGFGACIWKDSHAFHSYFTWRQSNGRIISI